MSLEDFGDDDDIELVNEKALNWFDVSAIGTGEMLLTAGWAWIVYIASLYGTKWTLIGFAEGALVINLAWWLYREMITAVPEPGSIQSYGREAGLFSLGTVYFLTYAGTYCVFMWLELRVAQGLLHGLFPAAPEWIWPMVVLFPVLLINLMGHQITGRVQAALVVVTLVGDILLAVMVWWLLSNHSDWRANWSSPLPVTWKTPLVVGSLWLAVMAGVLEVQQVLVDEWSDFGRSRDIGLLTAAWQLWARQIPLALGVLASAPLVVLSAMSVPTVELVAQKLGHGPVFYLAVGSMIVATYTTLSVFFMAEGRVLALYAQQGALPRVIARYSSRAVPWVALLILAATALIGSYFTHLDFIAAVMSEWASTLYVVVAALYIGMKMRKDLHRPLEVPFGVPIAILLGVLSAGCAIGAVMLNWQAASAWGVIVVILIFYDHVIVPRTKRGGFYRTQVLRRRSTAYGH